MPVRNEKVGYCEIAGVRHSDNGKVRVEMIHSENQPLKMDLHESSRVFKKVRVEMRVKEDDDVKDGKVYQKDIEMVQLSDDDFGQGKTENKRSSPDTKYQWNDKSNLDNDFKTWVKNTYDNLDKKVFSHDNTMKVMMFILGAALIVGVVALGISLSLM